MAKVTRYKLSGVIGMLICLSIHWGLFAQQNYQLRIQSVDRDSIFIANNLGLKTSFENATLCHDYIAKLPTLLQSKGYISSSVDSVSDRDNQTIIQIFVGEKISYLDVRVNEIDKALLLQLGWTENGKKSRVFDMGNYKIFSEKVLDYCESNGYPFAKVYLDSIVVSHNHISAALQIEKGFPYKVDSVKMYGPAKISRNFIHRYLNIDRGSLYHKGKLDKINQRILELPYLEQVQPWDITMLNTGSMVNLYLQSKKSNQVNVLAGFLPSNQQIGGKLLLTVDANLQLQNAFGGGENFGLVWQQIQPKSPKLHLQFTQPYMFNSPLGVDFLFQLYKRDSAFLNVNGQLGLLYMLSPNKAGKVFLQTQTSNVLEVDTLSIKISKRLPDVADVSTLNLGFDYTVSNTDYKFNPRKGNEISISAAVGNKTIKKNTTISQLKDTSFNYVRLYDSMKLKTYLFRLQFKAAQYFQTGKQTTLKTAVNAGWFQSPTYFRNELFQIGGYRLLRGFDEESIFTSKYCIGSVEYRYLLGQNSNFFIFTDFGWSKNDIIKMAHSYIGAGAGLSFETKGGIFNLSYAVGKRNDLSFDAKQSKIHFGYVSIF